MNSITQNDSTDVLEALDIEGLEVAQQEELLLQLSDLVSRGTMLRLIERMDEKTQDDFSALLDRDPEDEEVEAFLKERVPDADSAVEETLAELRNDILAVTS